MNTENGNDIDGLLAEDVGDIDAQMARAGVDEHDSEPESPPAIDFTDEQRNAMVAVEGWFFNESKHRQVFRLFGYAGAGKTSMAREMAEAIRTATGKAVVFGAYTGKAASVLRSKGCPANTIHGLIYKPSEEAKLDKDGKVEKDESGKVIKELNFHLRPGSVRPDTTALIVIDECSMVGEKLGADLLSFGVPVLVLGDPAQLPPVGDGGYFTNHEPDVLLTEVHRQADGCGVLDIATKVRTDGARSVPFGDYGDSQVLPISRLFHLPLLEYDQVLVGKNATRKSYNRKMRMMQGRHGPLPQTGDRLICLRNSHAIGLMNGEQVHVIESKELDGDRLQIVFDWNGKPYEYAVSKHAFEDRPGQPEWGDGLLHFDFGHAITTHKAQGSEWGNVLVIDESRVFRADADKWLYTAVTRASDRVTVVR